MRFVLSLVAGVALLMVAGLPASAACWWNGYQTVCDNYYPRWYGEHEHHHDWRWHRWHEYYEHHPEWHHDWR